MKSLVWFRRDLRLADNKALHHAANDSEQVIGLFVITPDQWKEHDDAPAKIAFWLENVRELSHELSSKNIPLLVREVATFDGVPDLINDLAGELEISRVYVNKEYEVNELHRDQKTKKKLAETDVQFVSFHDRVIVPPRAISTNEDNFYSVYTPYRKSWDEIALDYHETVSKPRKQNAMDLESDEVPDSIAGFDLRGLDDELWPAGEKEAQKRLKKFADHIGEYNEQRDIPSVDGTSQLSPYLTAGVISPRQCLEEALALNDGKLRNKEGPTVWISELIWRDFYTHVLVGNPKVSKHQPYKEKTEGIDWRDDADEFQRWCEGRTGYPIVDAGMRQLNQTGWMHNRLRMVTAMFLTKNLLIDWRKGEQYFMRKLIDGDLAANNGGWQWSASTGTDAVPYFRIFNPFSQSKRFDEEGAFIKEMCPELKSIPAKALHDEKKFAKAREDQGADYPEYVVDYKEGRERALAAFKSLND